jgi:topoisomerase IA-like protein
MAKYSKGAGKKVEQVMHEKKQGTLKSGSGKKVTSRKQAIAIALSEARKEGAKVPAKKSASKKGAGKNAAGKKSSSKKAATKKSASKKAASKKGAGRKR